MKKVFFSFCFLASVYAGAQMKEGKVVYERVQQMQFRSQNPEIANMMPRERKDNFELLFGKNQSLWQNLPAAEGDNGTISGSGTTFRMMNLNEIIHFNFDTKRRLDQRELFDREFLIEDSINMLNWKLHEETKTVLGHTVRKATAQRYSMRPQMTMTNGEMKREEIPDTAMITAWYATDIPVAAGPGEYQGQLPGLILELDINRGRTTYRAVEISPKVNLSGIKEPKGGKKMTQGEFAKERLKMMEEMQKNMPPGRTMQIRQ